MICLLSSASSTVQTDVSLEAKEQHVPQCRGYPGLPAPGLPRALSVAASAGAPGATDPPAPGAPGVGIGEPAAGERRGPRPQHNAPAGTRATWRGLARGPAWPSPLGPRALVCPPALTVAELQQRGRVVQAAIAGEAVLHAEAGPRPLRPRSPTHCALPSRRGAGAGAGPAVAAAGHHGNPGPPPQKTSTRRPRCPRGGGLGGVAGRRRGGRGAELGAPGSRLDPRPGPSLVFAPRILSQKTPRRCGDKRREDGKVRDACRPSRDIGDPLAHSLSTMRCPCAPGSCRTKHGQP